MVEKHCPKLRFNLFHTVSSKSDIEQLPSEINLKMLIRHLQMCWTGKHTGGFSAAITDSCVLEASYRLCVVNIKITFSQFSPLILLREEKKTSITSRSWSRVRYTFQLAHSSLIRVGLTVFSEEDVREYWCFSLEFQGPLCSFERDLWWQEVSGVSTYVRLPGCDSAQGLETFTAWYHRC